MAKKRSSSKRKSSSKGRSSKSKSSSRSRSSSSRSRSSSGRGRGSSSRGRSSRSRSRDRQIELPQINITLDQWLDIVGYLLLAIALLTLLSFASYSNSSLLGGWLDLLCQGFGWGAYLTPVFLGAVGLWLVLRDFGEKLPRLTPTQAAGVMLGYLALLATLHVATAYVAYEKDLSAVADLGIGGGHMGEALGRMLLDGFGEAGAVVALVTAWVVVLALTGGVTVKDAVQALQEAQKERPRRARPLPAMPTPPATEKRAPAPVRQEPRPAPAPAPVPTAAAAEPPTAPAGPLLSGGEQAWQLPPLDDILEPGSTQDFSQEILRQQARVIEETLDSLGAPVRVKEINRGPVVTQFGVEPLTVLGSNGQETKVKVSRVAALANDVALALEARTLRVEAPVPGKGLVGLEVPNPEVSLVALRDVLESDQFDEVDSPLRLGLGQDVSGDPVVADLTTMPHLLIAGTTGSGKSVCINSIIAALLLQKTPTELQFLMVDPKRVELTGYSGIPHLLSKVVVEMERVTNALQWVLDEMDRRYKHFSKVRATHIRNYNEEIAPRQGEKQLPYLVVVVDELADLMMMAPQETERLVCRIAQMARATGIHLVIATQRPSVDVVTGLIKANFPARIAFNVASAVDSRVILDMPGAERLLGQGDMLFMPPDVAMPLRLQGAFVSNEELRKLVQYWKTQARPEAVPVERAVQKPLWEEMAKPVVKHADELLPDVIDVVLNENRASISLLQRKLRIGYTRAARIMDLLEQHGVVGPQPSGGKAREVFPSAAHALLRPPPGT